MMKKNGVIRRIQILALGFCLFVISQASIAETSPPAEGGSLPELILQSPTDPDHFRILGLSNQPTFTIPQINASIVIIEIFSMYCPHCQSEAPRINDLYQKILKTPKLKDAVRMIGIGVGNSKFEVEFFRKTYSVPFPLVPDGKFTIHKQLGEVRTPYFIAVRINPDKTHRVFYSKLGAIDNPDQFLKMIEGQLK